MIKNQILGTAQFGLNYYGVSNFEKRKKDTDIYAILDKAFESGIRYFDTAPGYKSEKILGNFIKTNKLAKNVKIITKVPSLGHNSKNLSSIIKKSIELNCKVIITTDHGTINVKTASKVIGDKNTSQNLRYKTGKSLTYSLKDNIAFNDPHKINLPKSSINASYIFAKEDFYLVYPNNFNYYSNFFKNTYQHGGVSFEELVIPFIVLNS